MAKSLLLSPVQVGRHTFKNRVVMSSMSMYNHSLDGVLSPVTFDHYVARAVGGVGAIVVESTAVQAKAGTSPVDLGLFTDEQEAALAKLVDKVHSYGTKIGIQLNHAGRKARGFDVAHAPSALQFDAEHPMPVAMTVADIETVVASFVASAQRAVRAGFDFVEVHAAHGFLLNQFLSPLTNHRNDEFGGSVENRYRFLGKVLKAIKAAVDVDVHVRFSASELEEGGSTMAEMKQFLAWAQADGAVFFDISSGGVTPVAPAAVFPGYQALLSRELAQAGFPVGAVGMLTPEVAEYVLRSGDAQLVYVGRGLIRNPHWVYEAAKTLHDEVEYANPGTYPAAF